MRVHHFTAALLCGVALAGLVSPVAYSWAADSAVPPVALEAGVSKDEMTKALQAETPAALEAPVAPAPVPNRTEPDKDQKNVKQEEPAAAKPAEVQAAPPVDAVKVEEPKPEPAQEEVSKEAHKEVVAPAPAPAQNTTPEVAATAAELAPSSKDIEAPASHWSYAGGEGPSKWGDLQDGYLLCKTGKAQSPVDIQKYAQQDLADLKPIYASFPVKAENNGHTIHVDSVNASESMGTIDVDGKTYALVQLHFHTPSEHYLDGAPYPMELHLVHKNAEGQLAVVGVMMKLGDTPNPAIEKIWNKATCENGAADCSAEVSISANDLLPMDLGYYRYDGSLTTPPCSEGVKWHVLKTPIEISQQQLVAFQTLFSSNARPLQTLGDRVILGE